ncbi:TonB-dependent receptor, partial [Bacteroides thetaiotaomicron]|nr:TonB-dependent receptor [Bacteroides thetaiotaomicron]
MLVSLSEGTVTIPSGNSADTVLVQSLGYKSQYISLKDVFKRKNTYTIRLSAEMTTLGEVIIIGERSGITRYAVSGQMPSPAINHALGTSLG